MIGGVSVLSESLTNHRSVEVRNQLESHEIAHNGDYGGEGVKEQAHWGVNHYREHAATLHKRHRHLTSNMIEHIVCVILDAFIFPC